MKREREKSEGKKEKHEQRKERKNNKSANANDEARQIERPGRNREWAKSILKTLFHSPETGYTHMKTQCCQAVESTVERKRPGGYRICMYGFGWKRGCEKSGWTFVSSGSSLRAVVCFFFFPSSQLTLSLKDLPFLCHDPLSCIQPEAWILLLASRRQAEEEEGITVVPFPVSGCSRPDGRVEYVTRGSFFSATAPSCASSSPESSFSLLSYSLLGSLLPQHQARIFFSLCRLQPLHGKAAVCRVARRREESLHIKASTRKVTQGIERKTFLCANNDDEEDGEDWEKERWADGRMLWKRDHRSGDT